MVGSEGTQDDGVTDTAYTQMSVTAWLLSHRLTSQDPVL